MNTALKHWKEAATVILAAGKRHVDKLPMGADELHGASVVSRKENLLHKSAFDYEVLLLKRSRKSGFMPNAYVFPGGLLEPSDFSREWLDIFKEFRSLPCFGLAPVKQSPESRPPIFATDRMKLGSPIPGDVALRICAVRETFEESGVLLAVPKGEKNSWLKTLNNEKDVVDHNLQSVNEFCDQNKLVKWRSIVNENPSNFIRMCRELECIPNIWALREWGNWLTPTGVYGKERRYDTAFFICCLKETPHTLQDEKEIVDFKWSTPAEVLHSYQARELWIAPPQFYDLSRMCRFSSVSNLHSFASHRAIEGCEQWLPVRLVMDHCYISVLPGDQLYTENGLGQIEVTDINLGEAQNENYALHRIVCLDLYTAAVQINIKPKYNHLLPLGGPIVRHNTKSQL